MLQLPLPGSSFPRFPSSASPLSFSPLLRRSLSVHLVSPSPDLPQAKQIPEIPVSMFSAADEVEIDLRPGRVPRTASLWAGEGGSRTGPHCETSGMDDFIHISVSTSFLLLLRTGRCPRDLHFEIPQIRTSDLLLVSGCVAFNQISFPQEGSEPIG